MQYLRREISKHGFAVEMTALLLALVVLGALLADAFYAGSDQGRMIRDVVAAVFFGGLVTATVLAVGEPDVPTSNQADDDG